MEITVFEQPPVGTHAYLLMAPGRDDAVLVDAPPEVWKAVQPELKKAGRKLAAVLLTHGHWDHIADASKFQVEGIPVYAHPDDREWMENPMMQEAFMFPDIEIQPVNGIHWLKPGEVLDVAGLRFEIRHVPGHAPGSVLFYSQDAKAAFVGDAIFAGSAGRTDLPGGDGPQLKKSIRSQIYTLPGPTVLFPGHGPHTTVERERATNMFVRG